MRYQVGISHPRPFRVAIHRECLGVLVPSSTSLQSPLIPRQEFFGGAERKDGNLPPRYKTVTPLNRPISVPTNGLISPSTQLDSILASPNTDLHEASQNYVLKQGAFHLVRTNCVIAMLIKWKHSSRHDGES